MKRYFIIILSLLMIGVCSQASAQVIRGHLATEITRDDNFVDTQYIVENLTAGIIGPNFNDTYHYTIRNVATGEEVAQGTLASAFDVAVSQYVAPYAHAVFAVKNIPITTEMKQNPGYYLIFLSATTGYVYACESVFYICDSINPKKKNNR